ncbi:MAG: nuclear transport factor 2 family protein, partial [Oricola sp.]|nr:nuclear transport factor 2 family protein [Oricola sp.]
MKIQAAKSAVKAALFAASVCVAAAQPAFAQDWVTTKDELLDRIQIEDIMLGYYAGLDSGGEHGFADYFTRDGVMEVNGKVATGRDAIKAFYDNYSTMSPGEALPGKLHVLLNNLRIDVNGDRATVHLVWTEVNSDSIKLAPRIVEQG